MARFTYGGKITVDTSGLTTTQSDSVFAVFDQIFLSGDLASAYLQRFTSSTTINTVMVTFASAVGYGVTSGNNTSNPTIVFSNLITGQQIKGSSTTDKFVGLAIVHELGHVLYPGITNDALHNNRGAPQSWPVTAATTSQAAGEAVFGAFVAIDQGSIRGQSHCPHPLRASLATQRAMR
jgi:hypothetical protein